MTTRINLGFLILTLAIFLPKNFAHESECESFDKSAENLTKNNQRDIKYFRESYEMFLNFSSDEISQPCKDSIKKIQELNEIGAIKMIDASAKLSSGALKGNLNQLGDFDECLEAKVKNFHGKYCLAEIFIESDFLDRDPIFTNKLSDVSHIVPKTSSIYAGFCVPSTCRHIDIQIAVKNALTDYSKYISSAEVEVKKEMCQIKEETNFRKLNKPTQLTIVVFFLIVLMSIIASVCESFGVKNKFISAVSVVENFKEMTSTNVGKNEISVLNGIRTLITLLMVMSHKQQEIGYYSFSNQKSLNNAFASPISIPVRTAVFYTESFLMMSGFLTVYTILGKLNQKKSVNIIKEIFMRYLRFLPSMAAIIFFYAFIFPLIGNGPMWSVLITPQTELCREFYWRNLLMIHNWFGFEKICLFNLHHIGTDFFLFIGALLLVATFYKNSDVLMSTIASIVALSSLATFIIIYKEDLLTYVYYGASIQSMMKTADNYYVIPLYRCGCYAIGMFTALLLRGQRRFELSSKCVTCGWCLATLGLFASYGIAAVTHYDHQAFKMAIFSTFAPILFVTFFAWIIFIRQQGFENALTKFFEWKYFKVISTLSYSIYLVQFAVFNYNISSSRFLLEYHRYPHMFDVSELILILAASVVMTIFIELPSNNLRRLIFDKKP